VDKFIYKDSLMDEISPIVKEIQKLKKQAKEMGLFTDDRELLECGCGLMENVACGGRLFTCRNGDPADKDTGLLFEQIDENNFRCPVCKTILRAEFL